MTHTYLKSIDSVINLILYKLTFPSGAPGQGKTYMRYHSLLRTKNNYEKEKPFFK